MAHGSPSSNPLIACCRSARRTPRARPSSPRRAMRRQGPVDDRAIGVAQKEPAVFEREPKAVVRVRPRVNELRAAPGQKPLRRVVSRPGCAFVAQQLRRGGEEDEAAPFSKPRREIAQGPPPGRFRRSAEDSRVSWTAPARVLRRTPVGLSAPRNECLDERERLSMVGRPAKQRLPGACVVACVKQRRHRRGLHPLGERHGSQPVGGPFGLANPPFALLENDVVAAEEEPVVGDVRGAHAVALVALCPWTRASIRRYPHPQLILVGDAGAPIELQDDPVGPMTQDALNVPEARPS